MEMGRKQHLHRSTTGTINLPKERDLFDQLVMQFTADQISDLVGAYFRRESIRSLANRFPLSRNAIGYYFRTFQMLIAREHAERGSSWQTSNWRIDPAEIQTWAREIGKKMGRNVYPVLAMARFGTAVRAECQIGIPTVSDWSTIRISEPDAIVVTPDSPDVRPRRIRKFIYHDKPLIMNMFMVDDPKGIKAKRRLRKHPPDPLPGYWQELERFLKHFRGIPIAQFREHVLEFEWVRMIDFQSNSITWMSKEQLRVLRLRELLKRAGRQVAWHVRKKKSTKSIDERRKRDESPCLFI